MSSSCSSGTAGPAGPDCYDIQILLQILAEMKIAEFDTDYELLDDSWSPECLKPWCDAAMVGGAAIPPGLDHLLLDGAAESRLELKPSAQVLTIIFESILGGHLNHHA